MSPSNGRGSGGEVAIALFAGLAVGVIVGIFIAPKSGKETRNDLMDKSERIMEMGRDTVSDVVEKSKGLVESGKQKIEELKEAVK